ncbi:MAG: hypothetical protein ACHQD7_01800 [Chitinophagales bacterium]
MKTILIITSVFFSACAIAQPTVSGRTAPASDTIFVLPGNSITLTGTAIQANPGHPILDTTWVKTSGPAATITNSSNRMTTTVTGLVQGAYVFTLTAADKQRSASAVVNVKVISGILSFSLSYFRASRNDQGIKLTWQTNMESNNALFVVQKSIDGIHFMDIASIDSKAANGNSSTPLTYSYQIQEQVHEADMHYMLLVMTVLAFITLITKLNKVCKSLVLGIICLFLFSCSKSVPVPNNNSLSSKTEVRLKQVDLDGHFNYSDIKLVN